MRHEPRHGERPECFALADASLEILEKDIVGARDIDPEAVDEFLRRDDPPRLGHADAMREVGRAGGPVHHHRHLAGQMEAEEDEIGRHARRQHHAHMLLGICPEPPGHEP